MLVTCLEHDGPAALRIPRGSGEGVPLMEEGWEPLEIGKAETLLDGNDLLIIAYGAMVPSALITAKILKTNNNINSTVVNARFLRPLDRTLMLPLISRIGKIVTMEEGTLEGGFGAAVLEALNDAKITQSILRIGIPDKLVDHASPDQSKEVLGLKPQQIAERIEEYFQLKSIKKSIENNIQPSSV
tara:strand:- start:135 stop:692 length:558 start_codon:yes stop_codon:yes gene_type:complete